jgi:hypothetical protein
MKPKQKTICVRRFDVDLHAVVKAQAKAEGMLVRDWIERALTHELARARKEHVRMEADRTQAGAGWLFRGTDANKEPAKIVQRELRRIHACSLTSPETPEDK